MLPAVRSEHFGVMRALCASVIAPPRCRYYIHPMNAPASIPIYVSRPMPLIGWRGRLAALVVMMACLGTLGMAAWLRPEPSGMGSHRQFGLQSCQFERNTGLPCPTCGMTTSFAWFVRGNLLASFYVQPMGAILAMATTMIFWAAGYSAVSGKPIW